MLPVIKDTKGRNNEREAQPRITYNMFHKKDNAHQITELNDNLRQVHLLTVNTTIIYHPQMSRNEEGDIAWTQVGIGGAILKKQNRQ